MILQLQPREVVERAERFIEQQDLGLSGESACNCDALRHAARELAWKRLGEVGEPHIQQKSLDRGLLRRRSQVKSARRTFSCTVNHGIKRGSWKTTPTSARGPVTALPLSVNLPPVARSIPEMIRKQGGLATAPGFRPAPRHAGQDRR
jgi:hypothetical protein